MEECHALLGSSLPEVKYNQVPLLWHATAPNADILVDNATGQFYWICVDILRPGGFPRHLQTSLHLLAQRSHSEKAKPGQSASNSARVIQCMYTSLRERIRAAAAGGASEIGTGVHVR